MKLKLVYAPSPILNRKAISVPKITPDLVKLANNMLETMVDGNGIGLAAPQVNQNVRLIVVGNSPEKEGEDYIPTTILFNPKITKFSSEKEFATEGCLSIPGITGVVERSKSITVEFLDVDGNKQTLNASDLYARVIQHEVDHLEGVLFTDRLRHYSIVFYGTSDFAVPALEELLLHPQFELKAIVTETDKPAGRGHQLTASPVKKFALDNKIKVLQPMSLNCQHKNATKAQSATNAFQDLSKIKPDFQIVASYGKIIPQEFLDLAKLINLNIHPSLLPKYRGASPIQSAILHGETQTGVAVMAMAAEMDAGPVVTMYRHNIDPDENADQLSKRLAESGAAQLIMTLEEMLSNKSSLYEQDHTKATFTKKFESVDGLIDWTKSPIDLHNFVRALTSKPGAFTQIDGQNVKILKTHLTEGKLTIDLVQLPGKKPFSMSDLKNGYPKMYQELLNQSNK
ncbi:MAG: methionyl-tRNA formyltransferase [Patescibacteria group bacterium]|jgi:methionyl-tRNA formyltransferase